MSNVLPLNLTAMEEFYFIQKIQISLKLKFDGCIDRVAFEYGLSRALVRHPLMSAVVQRRSWRRPRWINLESARPSVHWREGVESFDRNDFEPLDLTAEPGIRVYVEAGTCQSRMVVVFHHACCDAQGAIQFLADLFTAYAQRLAPGADHQPAFTELVPERLASRDRISIQVPIGLSLWQFARRTLEMAARFVFLPADPLAVSATTSSVAERSSRSLTRTLESHVFRKLRRVARQKRVTVNDLLMREMFLALRDWNHRHSPAGISKRLVQAVPVNLRNLIHDGMPAANVIGFWYCSRPVADCDDPEGLLHSIHDESAFVKNSRIGCLLAMSFDMIRRVPGLLRFSSNRGSRLATILLSNVGDPWRAVAGDFPVDSQGDPLLGNLVLKDVSSTAALPAGLRAAFTLWNSCDILRMALECDGQFFSRDTAQELLDAFAARIVALANTAGDSASARKAA